MSLSATGPFLTIDDQSVAWVRFDDPDRSANVLTEPVMRRLGEIVADLDVRSRQGRVRAVIFHSGKPGSFIVGADIEAIGSIEDPDVGREGARQGQAVYSAVERLPVPTVCAIHGICVGGGCELALACRYRVASDSPKTRIGLPEVQLGILPAWGGTTRLPRLIGLQAALDLLLTGRTLTARSAKRRGLIEAILPAEIFTEAVAGFVQERLAEGPVPTGAKRKFFKRLLEDTAPGRRAVLAGARKRVMAQTGGNYPAPLKILEVVANSASRSVSDALEIEATAAGELIVTPESKNLVHVFHLRERARKGIPGVDAEPRQIDHMGIIGAGVMGGGIAQLAAYNGVQVRLKDIRHEAVAGALEHARSLFDKAVERHRLSKLEASQRMEAISGGLTYDGFRSSDLVVEAVVERLDIKRSVLAELETHTRSDCVLVTNTSSLSVDDMAETLKHPERFAGMHFFNPVHRMPLVEVVRGTRTDPVTLATVYSLALRMDKVPVVTRDGAGFLVNRILGPYLNEAGFLLADGASIAEIDKAAKKFGMPMGPLRLIDEVGIDVAGHAGRAMYQAFGDRLAPSPVLVAIGETDRLGKKGGRGFYVYDGKDEKIDDSVLDDLSAVLPQSPRTVSSDEITLRLVLVMVNEAARILEDRIVDSAGEVDLGMIMGTGFPPFRGGLLRYADSIHVRTVVEHLRGLRQRAGSRFDPAPLIEQLAEEDRSFYEAFPVH